jgi:N-methylhydantoinase A
MEAFAELEGRGAADFAAEGLQGTALRTIDFRYRGQGYELNVPYDPQAAGDAVEAFHRMHLQRYGFFDTARPVEIVNLRLRMIAAGEPYSPAQQEPVAGDGSAASYAVREVYFDGSFIPTALYRRDALTPGDRVHGPAMITEYTSATVLPPGCDALVDSFGNLVITVAQETA